MSVRKLPRGLLHELADCQARGGDLAVSRSTEDSQHIYEVVNERNVNTVLIGVYRGAGNLANKFYTVGSGVEVSYTNWKWGEPNGNDGSENCVAVKTPTTKAAWIDVSCDYARYFICELKL
jgi:hypothetical protein